MPNYSHVFGSNFPSSLIPLGTHKDIDDSVVDIVNQYNEFIRNGDTNSAYALYNSNKALLKPYNINMSYMNYLEEEINNTAIAALSQYQVIHSESEPTIELDVDSYWIREYE